MFGFFVELGPYIMDELSRKPKARRRSSTTPYAWTKSGSVLMFDWPPPVGFSYCDDDPTGKGKLWRLGRRPILARGLRGAGRVVREVPGVRRQRLVPDR